MRLLTVTLVLLSLSLAAFAQVMTDPKTGMTLEGQIVPIPTAEIVVSENVCPPPAHPIWEPTPAQAFEDTPTVTTVPSTKDTSAKPHDRLTITLNAKKEGDMSYVILLDGHTQPVNYMSIAGWGRWLIHKRTGEWVNPNEVMDLLPDAVAQGADPNKFNVSIHYTP